MKIYDFPNCCTARIMLDFGDTWTSGMQTAKADFDKLEKDIDSNIRIYGDNLLTAITNNQQTTINNLLRKYGFKHSTWMSKRTHSDTKLRLWWREPNKRLFVK